ncbi:MAG: PilZ domain-containing protein [Leptospiraceae bacterium]|nr:PilZ domain-containing protein [Leptospiraceae bacterium]
MADYTVHFEVNDNSYKGTLGNISAGGLCAIMDADFPITVNSACKGFLLDEPFQQKMPFYGKIVWLSNFIYKNQQKTMLGFEFTEEVVFPDRLEAISLTLDEG